MIVGCLLADVPGCGLHMAWDPGRRILMLIFKATVTALLLPRPTSEAHLTRFMGSDADTGSGSGTPSPSLVSSDV